MKKPIAWHEECLKNWLESIERKRGEIERMQYGLEDSERGAKYLALQISSAKRIGKDGFDSERFMVSRKNK